MFKIGVYGRLSRFGFEKLISKDQFKMAKLRSPKDLTIDQSQIQSDLILWINDIMGACVPIPYYLLPYFIRIKAL